MRAAQPLALPFSEFSAVSADNRTTNICGSLTFLYSATHPQDNDSGSRPAGLLFWEWPADNRIGNQHVKFFLALYAVDGLLVHRISSQSYKDMNNLFLFAMLAVNRNF